jgi:hypothetical protein
MIGEPILHMLFHYFVFMYINRNDMFLLLLTDHESHIVYAL